MATIDLNDDGNDGTTGSPAAAPASPAVPEILQTGGPAFTHTDHVWNLDLGDVQAGSIVSSVFFGVLNAASAPGADSLTVTSDQSADAAFRVFGAPNGPDYASIQPGTGRGGTAVTIDTAHPGEHVQTITLHPLDVAADGIQTPLPDETVRISMNVVGDLSDVGTIPLSGFSANLSAPDPAQILATTPVTLGGEHFARIGNLGSWFSGESLSFTPSAEEVASYGANYLLAVFQQVHADLTAGGGNVHEVVVLGGKGGELDLGDGDHAVVWSFASDDPGGGNTAVIDTGAGQDSITLTAVGLDRQGPSGNLADQVALSSALPYAVFPMSYAKDGSSYDGFASTALVHPGQGDDTIEIQGKVTAAIELAQGDGHDTVTGFVSGADHIQISGVDPATASSAAATVGGQAGTLLTYGTARDSVFFAGTAALADGDVTYVAVPPPSPEEPSRHEPPTRPDAGTTDWNALAALAEEHFAACGQWFL